MNTIAIICPVLAGVIGGIAGTYLRGRITKNVKILLAFSGAYLLALTVMHLLPDIYAILDFKSGYFILLGFLVQIILDYFSRGVEHGHIHHRHGATDTLFPLSIYLSLFLHSMIEGLPLSGGEHLILNEHSHDQALLLGIVIHKIPEAIALAALLHHYLTSTKKVIGYIVLYSLATPIGILLGWMLIRSGVENTEVIYARILAIAVGIFIHVSTTIIFEADEDHRISWKKAAAIALGFALVLLM